MRARNVPGLCQSATTRSTRSCPKTRRNKDWWERTQEQQTQLTRLLERLQNNTGDLGETLHELNVLTEHIGQDDTPTPQERARMRQRLEAEHGPEWRARAMEGVAAQLHGLADVLNRPSPSDLDSAIIEDDLAEARHLLDAGVDPNSRSAGSRRVLTLALLLERFEIAALLRERGANVTLIEAVLGGDNDQVAALLDQGADVNAADEHGDTPVKLAVSKGHAQTVRLLLLHNADPARANRLGHTPLATACLRGYPEIADMLRGAGLPLGLTEAALLGDLSLIRGLLAEGADVEFQGSAAMTPLMAAAGCGHWEAVRLLLDAGALVNAPSAIGQTALSWAIAYRRVPVVHLLLDRGADLHGRSPQLGNTPLMDAVMSGKAAVAEALLQRGANVNAVNEQGKTALFLAVDRPVALRGNEQQDIAVLLLDAGADIEARDTFGRTPLMHAAHAGNADRVRVLLARGADVRARSKDGHFSPLSDARQSKNAEVVGLVMEALGPAYALVHAAQQGDTPRMNGLLDGGVDANGAVTLDPLFENNEEFAELGKETPLSAAVGAGQVEAVRLLLARGAETDPLRLGELLRCAEFDNKDEIVQLLRAAGAVAAPPQEAGPTTP